jgi:thiol-disulfide isomerase/thioredoxin
MDENKSWVDERLAALNPEAEWKPEVTSALARVEGQLNRPKFMGGWPRIFSVAAVGVVCLFLFPQSRAAAAHAMEPCVEACQGLVSGQTDIHDEIHQLIWAFHSWMHLTVPNYAFTDAKGENFRLSQYTGKVVLLNFWATWCVPCKKEIPWFVEFQREYGDKGFAVIGVSVDDDGWKAVRPFIEAQKINYRVALADQGMAQSFGDSVPCTILINRKGLIISKHTGIKEKSQYEREIMQALWSQLSRTERDRLRPEGLEQVTDH